MAYVGNTYTTQGFVPAIDYFSGNGSTTAFTLSRPVASVAQVQVTIENVPQNPSTAFTVNSNTITFTSAPPSGTNNIYVQYTSPITQVVALPQSPQVFGNLQFSSSGARITGDFSNATVANRVMFQTSTVNGGTTLGIIPNGTATSANFGVYGNSADPSNSSAALFGIPAGGAEVRLNSIITGTGTYLPMTFFTGGSERMRLDTSGNLGIGTSSPLVAGSRLSLKAAGDYEPGLTIGSNASALNWSRLDFKNTNAANSAILYQDQTGTFSIRTDGAYPIAFLTNGANERMRIDSSGNVGIGTSSVTSGAKLQVTGSDDTYVFVKSDGAGDYSLSMGSGGTPLIARGAGAPLAFGTVTNNSVITGWTEQMRIDSSGNLAMTGGGQIRSNATNTPVTFADSAGTQVGTLCRAWVNFDGTTSPGTIRASFNVTSVTKNATGSYAVNLTNALADTKGSAAGSAYENATGTYTGAQRCVNCSFISSSSLGVFVTYQNGGPADTVFTSVSIFR